MSRQNRYDKPSSVFGMDSGQLDRILALGLKDAGEEPSDMSVLSLHPLMEQPGAQIGRYRLLHVLGEGGMGVVYLAEQTEPIQRQVALKIIKPGMDSRRVLARFEAEEQVLALMDHPHIAHVYDAELAPSGRPYFVMEHIRGTPITEYCDRHRLTIEQRLCLFLNVCEAIQHAHQKGVIHRDLKPSNILVTGADGRAVPKVIDFGVARAIRQSGTEQTLCTEDGQLVGTPEYMSPEQADPGNRDIDTRTDVYSLGVLLYELLVGMLPFDRRTFCEGVEHVRQVIREQDPAMPSTRLSRTSSEESLTIAERRHTDVRTLQWNLRGDLDWIALKAMEKERSRRYASVDAMATDIRSYLNHQPVAAAPPGVLYRARKFFRRHRPVIVAAATILLLGLALLCAGRAHTRAEREHAHARQLEHERILSEARELFETRITQGVRDLSSDALARITPLLSSPYVRPQAEFLFASILAEDRRYEEAIPRLESLGMLVDHPEIAGAAHALLARIIWESPSLGPQELKTFQEHREKAEQLRPRTADAYYLRAMTALTIGEKLDLLAAALRLDPGHYPSRRLRAFTYQASRKYELLKDDALLMMDRWPSNPLGYSLRATALRELGPCDEAVKCYDAAIELTDRDDPQYIQLNARRCETLMRIGQYARTLDEASECLAVASGSTLMHFHRFCALTALGRYEEARSAYRAAIGSSDPATISTIRDRSMKYVFDMLEAGMPWHPSGSDPEGASFLPFRSAEETYRALFAHAHRLITDAFSGSWSPDGDKVIFSMGVYGYSGVATYDMTTHETDLLLLPGKDPCWSPDGQYIAFVRDCEALPLAEFAAKERSDQRRVTQDEELWVMSAEGTEPKCLARGARWPSWNSDANHIYYQSLANDMLCSIATDGNEAEPVPIFASSAASPSVSPKGDQVAYVENGWLRITEIASQSDIAEWAVPLPIWGGNWSPDGREFGFGGSYASPEARAGFWIYELDKAEAFNVLDGQITAVSWSRDKTKLLLSLGPPYFEIWVADIDPNLPTAKSLGPVRTKEEILLDWIDTASRKLELDPNQLAEHWARAAAALWIGDDRASQYIQEMGRAIDRQPGMIDQCWWWAKNTIARPAVNNRVLPLTLMMTRKAVEQKPIYTRDFALTLYRLGRYEEATHYWQISEANAPDGGCHYDEALNCYTIEGFGVDIWEAVDDFHYAYKHLNGDGSITARIDSIEQAHEWTKAGVMIRNTLNPDSPNAMLLVTSGGIVSFQHRSVEGTITHSTHTAPAAVRTPHWLRLVRQDNRFIAQHSNDGVTWQDVLDASDQPARIDIPMEEAVYLGLAITSHDVTRPAMARISQVATSGRVEPPGPFIQSQDIPVQLPPVPSAQAATQ